MVVLVPTETPTPGDFDPVPGAVVPDGALDPAVALPVVAVTDGADVVVVSDVGVWDGGTSVDALQICAYDAGTDGEGGGLFGLSEPPDWYRKPTTSSVALATGCSVGPSLAYTHVPEVPCQYDQ